MQDGACGIQAGIIYAKNQAVNAAMSYLNAFGFTRRSRGIHHVGQVIDRRSIDQVLPRFLGDLLPPAIGADDIHPLRGKGSDKALLRQ